MGGNGSTGGAAVADWIMEWVAQTTYIIVAATTEPGPHRAMAHLRSLDEITALAEQERADGRGYVRATLAWATAKLKNEVPAVQVPGPDRLAAMLKVREHEWYRCIEVAGGVTRRMAESDSPDPGRYAAASSVVIALKQSPPGRSES